MKQVLVAIPVKISMAKPLRQKMDQLVSALIRNNPGFEMDVCVFEKPFQQTHGERSIFDRPAQARNALIEEYLQPRHDYVFWIDADLVHYEPNVLTQLEKVNPGGVTAPLILIEPTDDPHTNNAFYDLAAFAESGQPVFRTKPRFGNLLRKPPYFRSKETLVDCDSVGCCYLIPAEAHRRGVKFAPTPLTDHFPVIHQAKMMGMRVCCARNIVVHHACLPKYGEAWHREPMEIWKNFNLAKYGLVSRPGRADRAR